MRICEVVILVTVVISSFSSSHGMEFVCISSPSFFLFDVFNDINNLLYSSLQSCTFNPQILCGQDDLLMHLSLISKKY